MSHNFVQNKSMIKNSVKIVLCILMLIVSLTVTPVSAVAPVASFVATPTSVMAPVTSSYTDLSSNTPSGGAWFFGDGTSTALWTQVTASAGWSARHAHSSVVIPDGSIVLMGGNDNRKKNDVWRSTDNGATWKQMTANAGWLARAGHSSVVMPDGSIVLMGGGLDQPESSINDVWRSTDNGATWTQMTASAGWTARVGHSSVVMPDGSIVLMGGANYQGGNLKNDVWRSTNNGATWTQMSANAGWTARAGHSSVVMPDGSIVLMGGGDTVGGNVKNDVWRSTNNGATWTQITASAGWTARAGHSSVVMPDSSIMLMGGGDNKGGFKNDVWQSTDNGATWTQMTASAGWTARRDHTTVFLLDRSIVLMGGIGGGSNLKNDVWRLMPGVTPDVTPPTITITYPKAFQRFTTATITISGTASDNVGLSKVEVKVGSGGWQTATGTTSWSKPVTLIRGLNKITARATDTSGNFKDASVLVAYIT